MEYLRNLPTEQGAALSGLIQIQPGRVVSRTLSHTEGCQMTLLAFDAGEGVSETSYCGDTFYYVLEGCMPLATAADRKFLSTGECIAVPAHTPHAIGGDGPFKLLQITLQA